jgi:hypothetical protein
MITMLIFLLKKLIIDPIPSPLHPHNTWKNWVVLPFIISINVIQLLFLSWCIPHPPSLKVTKPLFVALYKNTLHYVGWPTIALPHILQVLEICDVCSISMGKTLSHWNKAIQMFPSDNFYHKILASPHSC